MKLSAVARLSFQPIHATWYRTIPTEYWNSALNAEHTIARYSRFGSGSAVRTPYELLYLAENQVVSLFETGAVFGPPDDPIPHPRAPRISILDAKVRLQTVVDLTEPSNLRLLQTSLQELTGSWRVYDPGLAPTQKLGAALFAAEHIEGFLALSAKMPLCKTLVVFPQKMRQSSEIVFEDLILKKTRRIRGN